MTEYKVMTKYKGQKRYHATGHHTDANFAERDAMKKADWSGTVAVKMIITDRNGISNTIIYK